MMILVICLAVIGLVLWISQQPSLSDHEYIERREGTLRRWDGREMPVTAYVYRQFNQTTRRYRYSRRSEWLGHEHIDALVYERDKSLVVLDEPNEGAIHL